jgi:hypothetical protein
MAEGASLTLPKDLIEATINQHVQAAVCAALADKTQILQMAVGRVLTEKVDSDLNPCTWQGAKPFIEMAVQKSIRDSVQAVLNEELAKHHEAIKTELARQLSAKNSPLLKLMVESLATGMVKASQNHWSFKVEYGGPG